MNSVGNEIIDTLRVAMKSRAMTYNQVAEKIGVSEKTIKRLFKDKDCSLSRLSDICDAIGISVYDLLDCAKRHTEPKAQLSESQEQFLKTHPHHFYFLFFLINGYSLGQIQNQYRLTDLSIFRYLRDLDRERFIALGEHNRFRLLIEGKLLMQLHGQLHQTIKDLNSLFLNYVLDKEHSSLSDFNSSYRYMTRENKQEMVRELDGVSEKYRKIAHQDQSLIPREQLIPVKWATLVAQYDVCGIWPLKEHQEGQQSNVKSIKRATFG